MRCPTLKDLPPPPPGKTGWPWTKESPRLPDTMRNGKPWPRISIITPSYNQGRFIEETIRSVLLQGYPNLEYIIIDGGSNDDSVDIIRKYDQWLTYWVSEPDQGMYDALNKGLEVATGDVIGIVNADDVYEPEVLRLIGEQHIESVDIFCGDAILFASEDGTERVLRVYRLGGHTRLTFETIRRGAVINACFISRRLYSKVGWFCNTFRISGDRDLLMRMALLRPQMSHVGRVVYRYRFHDSSLTNTSSLTAYRAKLFENYTLAQAWLRREGLPHEAIDYSRLVLANSCFGMLALSVRDKRWHDAVRWSMAGLAGAPKHLVQLAANWTMQKLRHALQIL